MALGFQAEQLSSVLIRKHEIREHLEEETQTNLGAVEGERRGLVNRNSPCVGGGVRNLTTVELDGVELGLLEETVGWCQSHCRLKEDGGGGVGRKDA